MAQHTDDDDLTPAIQRLLGSLGENVDVLVDLRIVLDAIEARYARFARRWLKAGAVAALAVVIGFVALRGAQQQALNAAHDAGVVTANLTLLASENRVLIDDLKRLARQAQLNGARADAIQCREIEKLKTQIRAVLRASPDIDSPAGVAALERFKQRNCHTLPNAKPVSP